MFMFLLIDILDKKWVKIIYSGVVISLLATFYSLYYYLSMVDMLRTDLLSVGGAERGSIVFAFLIDQKLELMLIGQLVNALFLIAYAKAYLTLGKEEETPVSSVMLG